MSTDTPGDGEVIAFDLAWVDTFAPFHLCLDREGRVVSVGRTLKKITDDIDRPGSLFFDGFKVKKPRGVITLDALAGTAGKPITVVSQSAASTVLKGMVIPLRNGGYFLNFSLGPRIQEVAEAFSLSKKDFCPSDNTGDLLFALSTQKQILDDAAALMEQLRQSKEDAAKKAVTDALTGLPNRRGLHEILSGRPRVGAIIQLDLDHFKPINDTFGHDVGDAALIHAASVFRTELDDEDVVARTGGDEFVAIRYGEQDRFRLARVADRIVTRIAEPLPFADYAQMGVSIGIRIVNDDHDRDIERFLADADLALYSAKRDGRGRWSIFENQMRQRFHQESETQRLIRDGLMANAFVPFFQPQISIVTGHVIGLEVLARLDDPKRGMITPDEFLEVADRLDLLAHIDDQVRLKAFDVFANFRAAGMTVPLLSFNISPKRLSNEEFSVKLGNELERHGLRPGDVALEITETVLFDTAPNDLMKTIEALAATGFQIHLDGFGTGRASFSSLLKFPVARLKIDSRLVKSIDREPKRQEMVRAIVDLGQHLGVTTLAKGVETDAELDALVRIGCHEIQGFKTARPMDAGVLKRWLLDYRPQHALPVTTLVEQTARTNEGGPQIQTTQ